jgi:NDP-sugar pyrophosphorylase family protein
MKNNKTMTKKYKLTNQKQEVGGYILHRIKALRDFGDVKKGDLGGWIEKEDNLSHEGNCWVSDEACVYEYARVFGNALVSGNALVFNDARVYGDAQVSGNAYIYGNARIYGSLKIKGGNFYHTKSKLENVDKIENDEWHETLCFNPMLDGEPQNKKRSLK